MTNVNKYCVNNLVKMYKIAGNTINEIPLTPPKDARFSSMEPDMNGLLYISSNKGVFTLDKNGVFKPVLIAGLTRPPCVVWSKDACGRPYCRWVVFGIRHGWMQGSPT